MSETKTTSPDSWASALLSALSEPTDREHLRQLLTRIQRSTAATEVHLLLTDEILADYSFREATIACAPTPLLPPEDTQFFSYPLRSGADSLGELRLYHPEADLPRAGMNDVVHLLNGVLRVARAEHFRGCLRRQEELQQTLVHDLRSPLATLRAYLDLISEELPEDSDAHEYLAAIRRAANQQEDMLSQLLALYEAKSGQRRKASLHICPLLEAAITDHRDAAALAGLRLETVLDLPACLQLVTEEQPLRRALFNLLGNAIRYTPQGGTVQLCAAQAGGRLWLRVRDDGPGVPLSVRERLFLPFERAPVAGVASGSGLGLAFTKAVAERLGGGLSLEKTEQGSEFALWLPLD